MLYGQLRYSYPLNSRKENKLLMAILKIVLIVLCIGYLLFSLWEKYYQMLFVNKIIDKLIQNYGKKLPVDTKGNVVLNIDLWDIEVIFRIGVLYMTQMNFKMAHMYFSWAKAINEKFPEREILCFDDTKLAITDNIKFCEHPTIFHKLGKPENRRGHFGLFFLIERLGNKRHFYPEIDDEVNRERRKGELKVDDFV